MTALQTNDSYDNLFDYYGQVYNVDPALTKTAFHLESSGNPNTKDSPAGAQGGMQIMPALAAHYGIDPHDMTQAIPAATAYLAEGLQATGGSPAGALAYYNGGPKTLQRWLPETQNYVAKAQSYYPQMKFAQNAASAPAAGTATDSPAPAAAPMVVADAGAGAGDQAFKNRWGIGDTPAPAPDDAFRNRWGLTPANGNTPPASNVQAVPGSTTPATVSDSAASAPPAPVPSVMGNPAAALNSLGGDQFVPNPLASNPSQGAYTSLRGALEPAPNATYGNNLPFAQDNATGENRWALPSSLRSLAQGAVDLAYGPRMGTVTPEATNALAAGVIGAPGFMRSPAAIPGRFTIFPRSSPAAAAGAPNPLASPGAAAPVETPSFAPGAGRTLDVDADGNVTHINGVPVGGNPLATRQAAPASSTSPAPTSSPANPLATAAPAGAPAPLGPIVPPSSGLVAGALSPIEQRLQAAIKGPAAAGGPIPPGWQWNPSMGTGGYGPAAPATGTPAGTPPLGTPGYTPTTPGVAPSAAAGLSPAEQAIYAATRDTPPPAPLIPPLTRNAAANVADQIIQHFYAGKPPLAPADVVVPPGYHPSLTGLTNDPGLATLHRGLEGVSSAPAMLADSNAQAINAAAQRLTGQPGDADLMQAQVNATTTPMREAAFANKTDMDPAQVNTAIAAADKILAGPDSKRPGVVKYVQQIRDAMHSATGNGAPESDPEMMYGAHKAINDILSPVAQSTDADKQAASAALTSLKPLVKSAIESGAPGFEPYMAAHADLMKPVDAQRYLESLNLTNATGDTRLAAVDSAIKSITKQQAAPGISKAEWVSPDQLNQLTALRNALRMEAARGAGKPINSTTFQNLATNSIVSRIAGNPLANLALGQISSPGIIGLAAGQATKMATESQLARSEGMVREALLERLLNVGGKGEATLARGSQPSGPRSARPGPGAPWNMPNPLSGNGPSSVP